MADTVLRKVGSAPPCDTDAEAAVLSAVILAPLKLDEVRDLLEPSDFWHGPHRSIYEALLELDTKNKRVDEVTVVSQLRASGELKRMGGSAFIAQLLDATPSVANVLDHARIVRELGVLRRMGGTLRDLATTAYADETRGNVGAFLERCESEVFTTAAVRSERETGAVLHDLLVSASSEFDPGTPQPPRGHTTGFRELDALTLGLGAGELWYLAGRPGMGKTALALGMAEATAATGRHAIVFSLEMSKDELRDRMISMRSGVPHKSLVKREVSRAHYENVLDAVSELGRMPIFIDDDPRITPARLRSRVRRHSATLKQRYPFGLGLIVVDYVQLMADDDRKSGNRQDELERISRALKLLAREFQVPVVALSQMNRGAKGVAAGRPSLTDLRGSGALEQDADKVLFVHRPDGDGEGDRGEAELILAKGRNAGTGHVNVGWQSYCVRFTDAPQAGFDFARARAGDD